MQTLTIATVVAALGAAAIVDAGAVPRSSASCAVLPRETLRVRLVLDPGVPEDLREPTEATVAMLWRGEGVAIEWLPLSPDGELGRATSFWLRITARPIGDLRADEPTLGAVRFIGGQPHRDVLVSWPGVREWARRQRERRFKTLFFGASPFVGLAAFGDFEALARRAAAYAGAHEVGHFVLGSRGHDRTGLMRRDLVSHVAATLDSRELILADHSRTRLRDRIAQGAACATVATRN